MPVPYWMAQGGTTRGQKLHVPALAAERVWLTANAPGRRAEIHSTAVARRPLEDAPVAMKHDSPADVGMRFVTVLRDEVLTVRAAYEREFGTSAPGDPPGPLDRKLSERIGQLVDVAFFASTATEEGRPCQPSLVWAEDPKRLDGEVRSLRHPQPLEVDVLRKLAPLCVVGETFLIVDPSAESIVGTFRPTPTVNYFKIIDDDTVRVYAPRVGVVVVAHGQRELVRYEQGTIVEYPSWPFVRPREPLRSYAAALFGDEQADHMTPFLSEVFLRILIELRRVGCGGILAVLGEGQTIADCVSESKELEVPLQLGKLIRRAFRFLDGSTRFRGAKPTADELEAVLHEQRASRALRECEKEVARLASVDGAVLLSHDCDVLAFGAKLKSEHVPTIFEVDEQGVPTKAADLGRRGLRHRAAAAFASGAAGRAAFIVSQDGGANVMFGIDSRTVRWPVELPYSW